MKIFDTLKNIVSRQALIGAGILAAFIAVGIGVQVTARHVKQAETAMAVHVSKAVKPTLPPPPVVIPPTQTQPTPLPAPKPKAKPAPKHKRKHHARKRVAPKAAPIVPQATPDKTLCFPWGLVDQRTGQIVGACKFLGIFPTR